MSVRTQAFWLGYVEPFRKFALLTVGLISVLMTVAAATGLFRVDDGVAGSVLLVFTLLVAASVGFWAGLLAAVTYNLILLFFFLDPVFVLRSDEPQHTLLFPLFLLASLVGASLLQSSRNLAEQAQLGKAQSDGLLALNRAINAESDPASTLAVLCREAVKTFAASGAGVLTRSANGWLLTAYAGSEPSGEAPGDGDNAAADAAARSGSTVTLATGTPADSSSTSRQVVFVPLEADTKTIGVLRLDEPAAGGLYDSALMVAFAREGALALSRLEIATTENRAEALRRADELKTSLLNSISHDLKTPLASIKTSTSSLRNRNLRLTEDDRQDFYETIGSEADRLDRTISDLLALSRIDSGSIETVFEDLTLSHIVEDALELRHEVLDGREVSVNLPSVRVRTDGSLARLAVANLVENAARYSVAGGAISVGAEQKDGAVRLYVEDEGPGVGADELEFVFNPYYRARKDRALPNGSGLGLAIVKGFVELCGGTVGAEQTGKGMRFTIELPAVTERPVAP